MQAVYQRVCSAGVGIRLPSCDDSLHRCRERRMGREYIPAAMFLPILRLIHLWVKGDTQCLRE